MVQAAAILNGLPFTKLPAEVKGATAGVISPSLLFTYNDKELLSAVCSFLQEESEKRHLRSEKLRGKNITRFERDFNIGDLVKFNIDQSLKSFGFYFSITYKKFHFVVNG